jgi:hypothetical protein
MIFIQEKSNAMSISLLFKAFSPPLEGEIKEIILNNF